MARYLIDPFVFIDANGVGRIGETVNLYFDAVLEGSGEASSSFTIPTPEEITEGVVVDDTHPVTLIIPTAEAIVDTVIAPTVTDTAIVDDTWAITQNTPSESITDTVTAAAITESVTLTLV